MNIVLKYITKRTENTFYCKNNKCAVEENKYWGSIVYTRDMKVFIK